MPKTPFAPFVLPTSTNGANAQTRLLFRLTLPGTGNQVTALVVAKHAAQRRGTEREENTDQGAPGAFLRIVIACLQRGLCLIRRLLRLSLRLLCLVLCVLGRGHSRGLRLILDDVGNVTDVVADGSQEIA